MISYTVKFFTSGVDKWNHSDDDYHYEPGAIPQDVHPSQLDTCAVNDSSQSLQTRNLDNFMNTLQTIIPPSVQFMKEYQNPCWYMTLSLTRKIKRMFMHKGGSLTDTEAAYIMSEMFYPERGMVTKSLVCIPKVFFIGFPRSGSTQLYQMLTRHPQLIGGVNKEPHWWTRFPFTAKFPHNILAIIRYLIHYQEASEYVAEHPNSLLIDGSQSTIWDTRNTNNLCILPSLISRVVPSAKYIVLMRDPVSRLYSDFTYLCTSYLKAHRMETSPEYAMQSPDTFHIGAEIEVQEFQKCLESLPLDVCTHYVIDSKPNVSVAQPGCGRVRLGISLYYVHIAKWLRTIPKEKFLFLRTDDLTKDPYAILSRIWKFLELPSQPSAELQDILYSHTHSNLLSQTRMKPQTQQMLQNFFETYNKKLAELLQDDRFLWQDTSN